MRKILIFIDAGWQLCIKSMRDKPTSKRNRAIQASNGEGRFEQEMAAGFSLSIF
jgi:hypothetical protein